MNPSWFRTLATAAALLTPMLASAQFSGDLVLWPKGCEAAGQCIIKEALRFKDASGMVWEAKAGLKTDGASIPGIFQPFIGSPFETRFIKAAVIHDHYCDRHVRSWRMTHRVFYDALLDQGVSQAKAKTMYLAVLVGGPKWIRLIAGNACGKNCINAMKSVTGDTGFQTRPADYSLPALAPAMQDVFAQLEANPNALTLEQIEERAQQLRPGDFYFANGDTLVVTGGPPSIDRTSPMRPQRAIGLFTTTLGKRNYAMAISSALKSGSKGPAVEHIQKQLLALGYALPRFGADADLGDETLTAYAAFMIEAGLLAPTDELPNSVTVAGAAALDKAFNSLSTSPAPSEIINEELKHPHSGRSKSNPFRPWSAITAIVLHQTAAKIGETAKAWHNVPIHFGVTRAGKIFQLYALTEVCNHAGNLNKISVGIEIDGWFAGIEGKPETLWQPGGTNPKRLPMDLPEAQMKAVQTTIKWIIDSVAAQNGAIKTVHPHRQSSKDRQSDPGSLIWQTLGVWAKNTFGLKDGGKNFTVGDGLVIPEAWDSTYVGNKY